MKSISKLRKNSNLEFPQEIIDITQDFQEYIKNKAIIDSKLSSEDIKGRYTYSFAIDCLKNNSPVQLIKVIEELKKRYAYKLTNEGQGFLDSLMAKGYAYLAILSENDIKSKETFVKMATKLFESSYKCGYKQASIDFLDFKKRFDKDDSNYKKLVKKVNGEGNLIEKFELANIYFSFLLMGENAIRVIKDRRPIIESMSSLDHSLDTYKLGLDHPLNKLGYGFGLIVKGDIKEGVKLVNDNYYFLKDLKEDFKKILFKVDADKLEQLTQDIEEYLIIKEKKNNR